MPSTAPLAGLNYPSGSLSKNIAEIEMGFGVAGFEF